MPGLLLSGHNLANVGRVPAQSSAALDKFGTRLIDIGIINLTLPEIGQKLAETGEVWSNSVQTWSSRPKCGRNRSMLAELGHVFQSCAIFWRQMAKHGPNLVNSAKVRLRWPESGANIGPKLTDLEESWLNFGRIRSHSGPIWASAGPNQFNVV